MHLDVFLVSRISITKAVNNQYRLCFWRCKMKNKYKTALYFCVAVIICSVCFSAIIHFTVTKKQTQADSNVQSVPYYEEQPPDNAGLLFRFKENSSVFFNLDFYEEKVSVIFFDTKITKQTVLDYGYTVTTTFDTDYIFLAEFIDRFGGIEVQNGEILQRCTGVQITQMLENETLEKHAVITALLSKISFSGFTKNDLTFIIKNTQTQLSFPEGYPLIAPLSNVCRTINFVN